jgi:hypothetical protein
MKYRITFTCLLPGEPVEVKIIQQFSVPRLFTVEVDAPDNTPADEIRKLASQEIPPENGEIINWTWHDAYWKDPNFVPREYIPGVGWKS